MPHQPGSRLDKNNPQPFFSLVSHSRNLPHSAAILLGLVCALLSSKVFAIDDHILLCEAVVTPTAEEFIEIVNPTGAPVDLTNYYLSDDEDYALLPGASGAGPAPSIGSSDFIAQFPAAASIPAGGVMVIAFDGAGFAAAHGFSADFEILGTDAGTPDMIATNVGASAGLTNSGENAVIFSWDGASDLVTDVDMVNIGTPSSTNDIASKTGVSVDGPDGDTTASAYLADSATMPQQAGDPGFGFSTKRVSLEALLETTGGGNGITGDDETSEVITSSWDSPAFSAPNPGVCNLTPLVPQFVINEIHADPDSINGDANGDGSVSTTQDEFVEIVNITGTDIDISGWTVADGFGVRHTFPGGTVVPDQCAIVVFAGGTPTGTFGGAEVQTASGGSLGFNNGGDSVTLNDGSSDVASAVYGSEGGDNQSLTLDPDVTGGSFVKHTLATGSGGTLFSPGTRIDGSQFSGCPLPPPEWVINEIHADPDVTIAGDANGDGTRDGSQDEFVEIVNISGAHVDISGWTVSDAVGVRHTFPTDSVVFDGCSVVVFGGGAPTGAFGNSLVQTASAGFLGFNNSGDTVTLNDGSSDVAVYAYGSEGGDNQSLTLDPDITGSAPLVKHSTATGSSGSLFSPGTMIDGAQFDGCPVAAEIYEIQGSGTASPLDGKLVNTDSDVVTALAPDGFFMQTPSAGSDGNVNTSDGIFVFTGGAPSVAVGDLVDVFGEVSEFFGFTEIGGFPAVDVVGSGAVPAAVVFDATVPSPDPMSPSCAIEFECYEGMLVEIADGTVTGPNQRFGVDPVAEVHITAAPQRTFREPGIEFPGIFGFPEWDGNPEVFELDPDRLGLANQIIPAGSSFSATGVIGFEFGGYELWPSVLDVVPAPLPVAVPARDPGEFTVGSLNLFRLFDDVDDPEDADGRDDFVVSTAEYQRRLDKFCSYIDQVLDSPDILAVQEVESLNVLQDLADHLASDEDCGAFVNYTPRLIEGNDIGTIDVGFLVRDMIQVDSISQVDEDATFVNPITFEDDILHDRPPLLLEGNCQLEFGAFPIAVMAVHNRSLGGIDGSEGLRVRKKRFLQAVSIADKVDALQTADPAIRLVITGDFNAYEFTDGFVDSVGVITGDFNPDDNLVCDTENCSTLPDNDLLNEILGLPAAERYSFIFRGNAQALDHALTSAGLDGEISGAAYGRGNTDAAVDLINDDGTVEPANLPLRSSDHDGLVLFVLKDEDADGVPNDLDACPGTEIPESVPTIGLGINRWALTDENGQFDTVAPKGKGPGLDFDLGDTRGCSCEQIIDAQGLGKGHEKFGCSIGEMEEWVELVNQP